MFSAQRLVLISEATKLLNEIYGFVRQDWPVCRECFDFQPISAPPLAKPACSWTILAYCLRTLAPFPLRNNVYITYVLSVQKRTHTHNTHTHTHTHTHKHTHTHTHTNTQTKNDCNCTELNMHKCKKWSTKRCAGLALQSFGTPTTWPSHDA